MKKWKRINLKKLWTGVAIAGVVCFSLFTTTLVKADTSADITITASGYICGAPGGFTITYVNDYEVQLDWSVGDNAVNTMVRAAYGHFPADITDGYQVYYGNGTTTNDDATSLAAPDIVY